MNACIARKTQSGAVALFVVIFSTLLLSIVAVSFVQLMIVDQQQASNADLSRSAYDSAQAGVEDAKRLLILNQECQSDPSAASNCNAVLSSLKNVDANGQTAGCYVLNDSGVSTTVTRRDDSETLVQESTTNKLDQAYTCVKVTVDTDNYTNTLNANESLLIPLTATGPYQQIELSWFSQKDLSISKTDKTTVGYPSQNPSQVHLPPVGSKWADNDPALVRAQLIQAGTSFTLDDLDGVDSHTLFLYPANLGAINPTPTSFALDARRETGSGVPQAISCKATLGGGGYACVTRIQLQNPANGAASNRNAFLHLTALYNQSHFQVRLLDSSNNPVKFAGVEPEVDSTGRANDQFRRVLARVQLQSDMTLPDAALTVTGNLCKDFTVTTDPNDYRSLSACDPAPKN